jgi:hypothetical protein
MWLGGKLHSKPLPRQPRKWRQWRMVNWSFLDHAGPGLTFGVVGTFLHRSEIPCMWPQTKLADHLANWSRVHGP